VYGYPWRSSKVEPETVSNIISDSRRTFAEAQMNQLKFDVFDFESRRVAPSKNHFRDSVAFSVTEQGIPIYRKDSRNWSPRRTEFANSLHISSQALHPTRWTGLRLSEVLIKTGANLHFIHSHQEVYDRVIGAVTFKEFTCELSSGRPIQLARWKEDSTFKYTSPFFLAQDRLRKQRPESERY
jgi:hypothetical protein